MATYLSLYLCIVFSSSDYRDEMELPSKVNQKPIMFVNTESFLNEENLKKMETFSDSQEEVQRTCLHILGSVHQNHIDAPFVIRVRS